MVIQEDAGLVPLLFAAPTDPENPSITTSLPPIDPSEPDTTAPIIMLNGDSVVSVIQGEVYAELGAIADTGETVEIDGTAVDTSLLGTYFVTYNSVDEAGNEAITLRLSLIHI